MSQTTTTLSDLIARAAPTAEFPCVMRLHAEDPCKGWLLEIHAVWSLVDGHPLEDDDAAVTAGFAAVERFVAMGRQHLADPSTPGADLRIRLMGNSGEWAMYEFSSMDEADRDAAIARFAAAYGHAPLR